MNLKCTANVVHCFFTLNGLFHLCLLVSLAFTGFAVCASEDFSDLRAEPPYRGWYQPPWIVDEPELYEYANLHTSATGSLPTEILNRRGIAVLNWAFGPQARYANNDPEWFHNSIRPRNQGRAMDEWNTGSSRVQKQKEAAAEGYRRARAEWPDNFVACWVTGPCELFIELVRDGTFDLAMIEGYHWWFDNPGVGGIGYSATLNRVQRLREAGVSNRTVVGWGHVSAGPDKAGRGMTREQVERRVIESRKRYPEMPGIIFMSTGRADNPETRELIRYADRLSGKYYPDFHSEQEVFELFAQRVHVRRGQSLFEVSAQEINLQSGKADKLKLVFILDKLPTMAEIASAELIITAKTVKNQDRRVLQIFSSYDDPKDDAPIDARIWYEPGTLVFNVTQALREWKKSRERRGENKLRGFIINDVATGWNPPENETWRIVLERREDWENSFALLRIRGQ